DDETDEIVEEGSSNNTGNSIRELFSRVFINDSLSCTLQVEKPYYSARIYLDVCIECGSPNVSKPAKGEHPQCNNCNNVTNSKKKRFKWKQGGKNKQKH